MESLGIVGVSIHSQNLNLLEQLTIAPEDRASKLSALKHAADLSELVYLATCNRVEFVFTAANGVQITDVRNRILDFFFQGNKDVAFSPDDFSTKSGLEAVRYIFTVASALDSLVIGEAQILGQMKEAFANAIDNNLAGDKLSRIFQHAFKVAKKVRTDTDLGKKSVSMISLVTSLIGEVIQAEGNVPVALIGVGEMTNKLARFLVDRHDTHLLFVNRTVEKAEKLAALYGGQAMALETFLTEPPQVRIIASATSSPEAIFTAETTRNLIETNGRMLFIDLAIPRDVVLEKDVEKGIEIYNISDLKQISEQNRRQRFRDVDKAHEIVTGEVVSYHKGKIEEELRPVFSLSYEESKEFADKGLARLFETRLEHLSAEDRAIINHWVDKLVSYASFLPARAMAERIASQVGSDARAEETPANLVQHRHWKALRKGA
jgi:glutamyl-tRNA reductase